MKTRRSRGSEAAEAGGSTMELELELPSDIDVDQLEELLPDVSPSKLTPDAAVQLYKFILDQARAINDLGVQLEQSQSESLKKEIELDQTLQDHDMRFKELDDALSSRSAEVERLNKEYEAIGELMAARAVPDLLTMSEIASTRAILESEKASFSKSQIISSSEIEKLRFNAADHEREKRDLLSVIERLRSEDDLRDGLCFIVVRQLKPHRLYLSKSKFAPCRGH